MMFKRFASAAALAVLTCAAHAAPVTFTFSTVISSVIQPPDIPGGFPAIVAAGAAMSVSVTFDSDATLQQSLTNATGGVRNRFDPSSLSIAFSIGAISGNPTYANLGSGQILVRDDFADPNNPAELVDGITFSLTDIGDPNVLTNFQLTLRGPVLDLINNGALPTAQDPRWDNLRTAAFGICRSSPANQNSCDLGGFQALVQGVPEPSTLTLAGLGLMAAGVRRRRQVAR